ncbi:hypothetical protein NP493_2116g00009 [Ridgeia piscesae]|uniref:Ig-like domain-containing protein n=1 Tax=Ridgeia piscesae TaxID=27915 RepID=A0AAD9JKP6_RIDPI|nr:hypothetical protein NP493_2116g00009 [Ridgeia piscesae]
MQWRGLKGNGEALKAKDESSKGTVKFSIVVEIKPSHNGDSFTCHTYFDKPQAGYNYADNIPINNNAFNDTFTFPKLSVYYKPHALAVKCNGDVVTNGGNIVVGERMTVTAESNPGKRNYTWENTTSNETIATGDFIAVTENMLGNQSFKAVVCNTIPIPSPHTLCSNFPVNVIVINTYCRIDLVPFSDHDYHHHYNTRHCGAYLCYEHHHPNRL